VVSFRRRQLRLRSVDSRCSLCRIRARAAQCRIDALLSGLDFALQRGQSCGNLFFLLAGGRKSGSCGSKCRIHALRKGGQRVIPRGDGRIQGRSRIPDALVSEREVIHGLVGGRTRRFSLLRKLLSPLPQTGDRIGAKALEIGCQFIERDISKGRAAHCRAASSNIALM